LFFNFLWLWQTALGFIYQTLAQGVHQKQESSGAKVRLDWTKVLNRSG
jgi:hypothetical protein